MKMVLRNQAFYEDGEKFVQIKAKKCIVRSFWKSLAILIFFGLILFLISIITGIITIENIYDNNEYQPNLPSDKFSENELTFYRNKNILKKNYELIFDRKKRHISNLASKMKKSRQKRSAKNFEKFNSSELDPIEVSYFDLKAKIQDEETALELNGLEDNYRRCKRTVNDNSCNLMYEEMYKLAKGINERIDEIEKLLKEPETSYTKKNQTTEEEKTLEKKFNDLSSKKIELSGTKVSENETTTQKNDDEISTTTKQYTTESSAENRVENESRIKVNKTENLGQTNIFLNNFTLYFSTFYFNGKNQSDLPLSEYLGTNQKLIFERKKRHIDSLKNETSSDEQKNNETIYERFNSSELDPIEIAYFDLKSNIRDKRAKLELNLLEEHYRRCKRTINDQSCDEIFIKMYKLAREINDKIDEFSELVKIGESFYRKSEVPEDKHTRKKYGDMSSSQIENDTTTYKVTKGMTTHRISTSEFSTVKPIANDSKLKLKSSGEEGPVKFSIPAESITESIKKINDDITTKTIVIEKQHLHNNSKENELDIDDSLKKKYNKHETQTQFPSILVPPQVHEDLPSRSGLARANLHSDHDVMFETLYKKLLNENSHLPYKEPLVTEKPEIKSDLGEPKDWDPALITLFEAWFKNLVKNTTKLSTTTLKPEKKTALKANVEHKNDFDNPPFLAASGPFISLCEDFVRQNFEKNKPPQHQQAIGSSPDNLSGSFTHAPNHLFTGRAPNFPVTGESMKATAQYVFNPNFGMSGMPFCFYAPPENLKLFNQNQQSPFYGQANLNGMPGGMFFVPQNIHGNGQTATSISPYGHSTASGFHPFHAKHNFNQQQQPMFCAYMLNHNQGQVGPQMMVPSTFPGAFNFQMRKSDNETHDDEVSSEREYPNIPSNTDIIYASYANQKSRVDLKHTNCKSDSISCFSNQQCIPKTKWCDSVVDCRDASDETACSCKSRLSESRICDGYTDCPMGEDEMGCFGCNKLMFSCYHSFEEYLRNGKSTVAMCYSNINKCDGISDCLNGSDEMDCNLIISGLGNQLAYQKSSSEGFLHRNHKGRWYPVCEMNKSWAHDACENEIGEMDSDPFVEEIPVDMPGPFIRQGKYSEIHFSESCNNTMYVKCPQIKCGHSKKQPKPSKKKLKARRSINTTEIEEIIRKKRFDNDERVVGGELCKPMKWPFIVALYRNGKFLCGGVIFSDKWIITAAHCVINFHKYYYEVYAGLLRRSSYSSTIQIVKALYMFSHPNYEKKTMKNDLALIYLETPLKFNKWVRPICLPSKGKVSVSDKWKNGPAEGTMCTTVGWGATHEHGQGSDHLREVKIPILSQCKTKIDREANDICAGEPTGGRDACQGDSGGPLFCRSINDPTEWYLAGIVSHGEGCARPDEPGVYTRVAMYLKWIESHSTKKFVSKPKLTPLKTCPGHKCFWGGEKCIQAFRKCDRFIDCLGGEDEIGCEYPHFSDEVGSSKNATNLQNLDYDYSVESTVPLDPFTPNDWSFEIDSNENVGSSISINESKKQPEDSFKKNDKENKRIETTTIQILAENKTRTTIAKELNTEIYEIKTDKAVTVLASDSVLKNSSDGFSIKSNLTESPKSILNSYTESPKKIESFDSHVNHDTTTELLKKKLNSTEEKFYTSTNIPLTTAKVPEANFRTTVKPMKELVSNVSAKGPSSAVTSILFGITTTTSATTIPSSKPSNIPAVSTESSTKDQDSINVFPVSPTEKKGPSSAVTPTLFGITTTTSATTTPSSKPSNISAVSTESSTKNQDSINVFPVSPTEKKGPSSAVTSNLFGITTTTSATTTPSSKPSNIPAVSTDSSTKDQDSINVFPVSPTENALDFMEFTTEDNEKNSSDTNTFISTEKDLKVLFDERLEPTEISSLTEKKVEVDYPSTTSVSDDFEITTNSFVITTPQKKEKSGLEHYMGHPVHHKEADKSENIDSNKSPNTKNLTSIESTSIKPSQVATESSVLTEVTSQKVISSSYKIPSIVEVTTQRLDKTTSTEFKITTAQARAEEFSTISDIETSTDTFNLLESSSKKPGNITEFMRSLDKMAASFIENETTKPIAKEIPNTSNVQTSTETNDNRNFHNESDTNIHNSHTVSTENPVKEFNPSDTAKDENLNTEINIFDSILTTESIPIITLQNLKVDLFTEAPTSSENIEVKTETQFEFITIDEDSNIVNETRPVAPLKVFVPKEKPMKHNSEKNQKNNNKFICTKIFQSIDISNYCDRIIDCEDGTDEENCTCRDYLKGTLNILVCDGKADCEDLTDEENCGNCTNHEFLCPLSQRCIEISKRCDDNIDCQFKEDEMDCYALTNGKTVFLDGNKRPNLHDSGIFSRNKNGMWHIVCSDELNILMKISTHPPAEEICSILGFKGFKSFNIANVLLNNTALPSIIVDENISLETHRKRKRELIQNISNDCEAFFVECNPHSNNHEPIQIIQNSDIKNSFHDINQQIIDINDDLKKLKPSSSTIITEIKDKVKPIKNMHKNHTGEIIEYHSWSVDVYNNGKLKCHGILLDKYWIAVSETCCRHIRLQEDYAVAVLGGQINKNLHSKGPHQQIQRIDCMQPILESNIVLLHLENPIYFTRYVLPTFLPDMEKEPHESRHSYECMIVTHNKNETVISIKVKEIFDQTICKSDKDFKKKNINICLKSIDKHIGSLCHDSKINSATLLCRQDNSGWYPRSFFEISSENCEFKEPFVVEEIYKKHDNIQYVIGNHKCELARYSKPLCTTHRCPLGKCLNSQQFCDGKMDCHDGSDESPELCHKKECRPTDLRCKNGNCVSKSKFCDQIDDCGDLTDEPTTCSCYTYLKASDPGKICDGIRNCWDKSDENPSFCDCGPERFQCGNTDECVSRDVICDQEYDCPNGEDEQFCYGLEYPSFPYINNDGYGQVIEQSYGTWHTKCFPKNHTLTNTEIGEICKKLGYQSNDKIQYRLIEDKDLNDMVSHQFDNNADGVKVGLFEKYSSPTKARIINKFSPLRLNQHLTFLIKPSRPLTQLENWNDDDLEECYRLEIKCY